MREAFSHFFDLTNEAFDDIWNNALFVFDTSALLGFYRESSKIIDEVVKLIVPIRDRLWLPHQVGLEYYENLPGVKAKVLAAAKSMDKVIGKSQADIGNIRHPFLRTEMIKRIGSFRDEIADLVSSNEALEERIKYIEETIESNFTSVGTAFSDAELTAIFAEGQIRYDRGIPPGFMDANKSETVVRKFGDLVVWKQLLAQAIESKRPIIFITEDTKGDWWRGGDTEFPHPLLREEMIRLTGQQYYGYTLSRFVKSGVPRLLKEKMTDTLSADVEVSERADALSRARINFDRLFNPTLDDAQINSDLARAVSMYSNIANGPIDESNPLFKDLKSINALHGAHLFSSLTMPQTSDDERSRFARLTEHLQTPASPDLFHQALKKQVETGLVDSALSSPPAAILSNADLLKAIKALAVAGGDIEDSSVAITPSAKRRAGDRAVSKPASKAKKAKAPRKKH